MSAEAGLSLLQRAMASHHAKDGIRVNCVCPGMLYTPMMYGSGMSEKRRRARRERSLLKTEGNGWDCGAAVRFLASDEARYVRSSLARRDLTCRKVDHWERTNGGRGNIVGSRHSGERKPLN
jgi:NAD(P)-dependent dehydrogenase (short-subunit alcohol dehydrogenase family)